MLIVTTALSSQVNEFQLLVSESIFSVSPLHRSDVEYQKKTISVWYYYFKYIFFDNPNFPVNIKY